jgi:uncharacterized protein
MAPQVAEDVIRYIEDSGLASKGMQVIWHAGEPLAAGLPFYREACARMSRLRPDLIYSLQTNGTLITDEWCAFFKEHQVHVGVSIDGPQPIHDRHRQFASGKGSFELAMRGVERLKAHGIPFSAIAVVSLASLESAEEIYEFFATLGPTSLGLNIEEEEGIHRSEAAAAPDFLAKYAQFFETLYKKSQDRRLLIREIKGMINALYHTAAEGVASSQTRPFSLFSVDHRGNFSTFSPELLSMQHPDYGTFALGNIYRDRLSDVIRSEKFSAMHRDIEAGVNACREECEYFFLCGGGAPSNKLYENGTFASTETAYCRALIQIPTQVVLPRLEAS